MSKDRDCSLSQPRAYKELPKHMLCALHTHSQAAGKATLSTYSKRSPASVSDAQADSAGVTPASLRHVPAVCGDFCLGIKAFSTLAESAQKSRGCRYRGTWPGRGPKFGRVTLTGSQMLIISTSRWMGLAGGQGNSFGGTGQEVMCVPVIFIFLTTTAGRSTAAQDAVCVEVLKTSAGLGLSLDGGKSSMSGDGPLFIKRVYKGNVLENPICHPLPIFFPCMSVPSSWKSNLFLKNLKRF